MKPHQLILLGALVLPVVSSCKVAGDPTPLEALELSTPVERYGDAFWAQRRREDPDLWARAKAICGRDDFTRYPNCRPVIGLVLRERTDTRARSASPGMDPSFNVPERQERASERLRQLEAPVRDSQP